MLNIDNIREIAYQADYSTTKRTIESYPELNNDDFWKCKCLKIFPKEPYLDFYTGEENYLIREKGEFALAIDFSNECYCKNVLFEYFDMLDEILDLSSEKIHDGIGYMPDILVKFIPQKRFIIVKNDDVYFVGHCDNESDAFKIMQDDSFVYKDDKYAAEYIQYTVIDLKSITPYFWKLGSLSEKRKSQFKVYSIEEIFDL